MAVFPSSKIASPTFIVEIHDNSTDEVISKKEYEFVRGMTWEEFIASDLNDGSFSDTGTTYDNKYMYYGYSGGWGKTILSYSFPYATDKSNWILLSDRILATTYYCYSTL